MTVILSEESNAYYLYLHVSKQKDNTSPWVNSSVSNTQILDVLR